MAQLLQAPLLLAEDMSSAPSTPIGWLTKASKLHRIQCLFWLPQARTHMHNPTQAHTHSHTIRNKNQIFKIAKVSKHIHPPSASTVKRRSEVTERNSRVQAPFRPTLHELQ